MRHARALTALTVAAFATSACADPMSARVLATQPVLSASIYTDRTVVSGSRTAFGPVGCTDEPVQLTYKQLVSYRELIDARGGFHLQWHMNEIEGTQAVGLVSGATYQFREVLNETGMIDADDIPTTFTMKIVRRFIGQGSTPNFLVNLSYHFTIDATGKLTVVLDTADRECRP